MNIIDVNADNVDKTGFFCKMSDKKGAGYQRKLAWIKARFAEGLRLKMLDLKQGGRGFIEYLPGEYAWRPVYASGYMFIHCLWVVGSSKGQGYGALLLDECLRDAREAGLRGVAVATSEGNWLVGKRFLLSQGFESVDQAPPQFELMVKQFEPGPLPSFPRDWDERARRFGHGLTVVRTDQCPYLEAATADTLDIARSRGVPARVVELNGTQDIRDRAPSPYGVFSILLDGKLLNYYYLSAKDLGPILDRALAGAS